uniref:Mannosyltransferase n=1 Tax=Scleropages formosus TaxID=113540 RepID=A0A8C9U3M5_SCLFO
MSECRRVPPPTRALRDRDVSAEWIRGCHSVGGHGNPGSQGVSALCEGAGFCTSSGKAGQVWAPEGSTAFKCLVSARFCAALLSNISDCDETYNYWEPTHYLLYGKGMQTWEYSPAYAIRSYAYLWLHALPAYFHAKILQTNKVLVFYFLRCALAFACCVCELYFYKAVCKKFGLHVGRLMLAFLVLSTGMFCSSAAYLPSTFCMYCTAVAMTGWFQDRPSVAILGVAAGAIVGWPFSALLGLPIVFDLLLLKRKWKSFLTWTLLAVLLFLVPVVAVDSYHYGKLVIAPLNIILYNVFTPHGPDLYGTEPWHYYFVNGFLNFNIVFLLALLSLPLTALMEALLQRFNVQNLGRPYWLTLSPMYLWMLVFFTRPHKEERFLFPIYPLICLCGAVALSSLQVRPVTCTQSSTALPRTPPYTWSPRAGWSLCVWGRNGIVSLAASCCQTSQCSHSSALPKDRYNPTEVALWIAYDFVST